MAMRSQVSCLTVVLLLLVAAAGVQGHASSKLRGILGRDAPGSGQTQAIGIGLSTGSDSDVSPGLTCPAGKTVQIATLGAGQNPSCVKCGGQSQFACNGATCLPGLVVLDTKSTVQPLCIPDAKFKPRQVARTAKGKNFDKKSAVATFSVTKTVDCGILGLPCCARNDCSLGLKCRSNTCSLDNEGRSLMG